jgi:hypothetical protein
MSTKNSIRDYNKLTFEVNYFNDTKETIKAVSIEAAQIEAHKRAVQEKTLVRFVTQFPIGD